MNPQVVAVVVTYNPSLPTLKAVIDAVHPQVGRVIAVDNGSEGACLGGIRQLARSPDDVLALGANLGIAAAQNAGLRRAIELGATYGLLMDQDSIPESNMVTLLLAQLRLAQGEGQHVAAVGPRFRDSQAGRLSSFVRVGWLRIHSLEPDPGQAVVATDFLISSGALIPLDVLAEVGWMDEGLFIDHVDTEWCLRAGSNGFALLGVPAAVMTHTLGEHRREVWFLRWRTIPFHKPFRYYYIYRNSVTLYRRPYLPLRWKIADTVRCLKMFLVFSLLHGQRRASLAMMLRGLLHGMRNKTGKLES